MKTAVLFSCFLVAGAGAAPTAEDLIDHVDESLTWSAAHDQIRTRLSGALELAGYHSAPRPQGLILSDAQNLFDPRLTLFLDSQIGPRLYFFAQSRVDRGFDPGENETQLRLDEYSLRFTPDHDGRVNFQIGKFATVVGNWTTRHLAWDNPFITAPLPYANLTGIFDGVAANSLATVLRWAGLQPAGPAGLTIEREQYRIPIIWGPNYASGASVTGVIGPISYAVEIKNASLSSRPTSWDAHTVQWQEPTLSGRLGYRPNESWTLGMSASSGSYLQPSAQATLAPGTTLRNYREIVLAQDLSYAWHHVQFWAEAYETRFEIPRVGDADTFAYYFETKYKFTPQLFGAIRWNQQVFSRMPGDGGSSVKWGQDVWRLDLAPSYRFTPHSELKLQYSLQSGGSFGPRHFTNTVAAQFVLRF